MTQCVVQVGACPPPLSPCAGFGSGPTAVPIGSSSRGWGNPSYPGSSFGGGFGGVFNNFGNAFGRRDDDDDRRGSSWGGGWSGRSDDNGGRWSCDRDQGGGGGAIALRPRSIVRIIQLAPSRDLAQRSIKSDRLIDCSWPHPTPPPF